MRCLDLSSAPQRDFSVLEVRDLHVSRGDVKAIRAVSFRLRRGEILGIEGTNGAGKTTLLNALAGMSRAASGHINFEGRAIDGFDVQALSRRGLVMVPEVKQLIEMQTVAQNLRAGGAGRWSPEEERALLTRVHALLPTLSIRHAQFAGSLCAGQLQMLAIARALMSRPRLLLLDEPTAGLPSSAATAVYELLRRLRSEAGLSVVVANEPSAEFRASVDRSVLLTAGELSDCSGCERRNTDHHREAHPSTHAGALPARS